MKPISTMLSVVSMTSWESLVSPALRLNAFCAAVVWMAALVASAGALGFQHISERPFHPLAIKVCVAPPQRARTTPA